MFSEAEVMSILSSLPYSVSLTKGREIELTEETAPPRIFVGYGNIVSKNPTAPIEYDIYDMHGENLVQYFDIQIVCNREDLPTVWIAIYAAIIGKNPVLAETDRSGFTLAESGPMGFSNSSIWWVSRWIIGFPTVFTIV